MDVSIEDTPSTGVPLSTEVPSISDASVISTSASAPDFDPCFFPMVLEIDFFADLKLLRRSTFISSVGTEGAI